MIRVSGTMFGTPIPADVPVFDCRESVIPGERTPGGRALVSSGRAAFALNLIGEYGTPDYSAHLWSLTGSYDLRDEQANGDDGARVVKTALASYAQYERYWHNAAKRPAADGEGGSVAYRPVAVAICNYGVAILGDTRTARVESLARYRSKR